VDCARCDSSNTFPHSLSGKFIDKAELRDTIVPDIVDEAIYNQVISSVVECQKSTKDRIASVLREMKERLSAFDVKDQ